MTILSKKKTVKKYIIKGNFHLHTYYSDGIYSPRAVLSYAKKKGIKALAITDHNIIKGAQKAAKIASKYDLFFFPGIECAFSVDGKYYEVLAYFDSIEKLESFYNNFLSEENFIPEYSSIMELSSQIESFGGVAVAPHPFGRKGIFRNKKNEKRIVFGGNGYEEINAFTGRIRNKRAKKYLSSDKCLTFGSADMHFFKTAMDVCYTELKSESKITFKEIWQNMLLRKGTIKFTPKGKCFPPHMIWFQKFLCALRLDLLRHYIYFLARKSKYLKKLEIQKSEK